MPTFRIRRTDARGTDGQRRARRRHDGRGGRRAPARADPRHADHAGQGEGGRRARRSPRPASSARRSRRKNLAVFTRQFSVMIDAGLPLVQCLDILGTQEEDKNFAAVILQTRTDVEVGRVAGRRDAQAPEDVRPAVHQHDRGRRGGRHPRHDSQAAGDLHREGRQAAGPGQVGDDLPDRRHRDRRRWSSASFCGRSSRPSPRCSRAWAPSCRCRRASSSRSATTWSRYFPFLLVGAGAVGLRRSSATTRPTSGRRVVDAHRC